MRCRPHALNLQGYRAQDWAMVISGNLENPHSNLTPWIVGVDYVLANSRADDTKIVVTSQQIDQPDLLRGAAGDLA